MAEATAYRCGGSNGSKKTATATASTTETADESTRTMVVTALGTAVVTASGRVPKDGEMNGCCYCWFLW